MFLIPYGLTSPSLRATISSSAKQSTTYSLRHWNLRNLTLQQECYLTNARDLFRNTHGSIMLPPRQPRVFARLGSSYLSNTPTNLCTPLYCILLYCVVLNCIVLLIYCYVDIIQYNGVHKFVGVLDNPRSDCLFLGWDFRMGYFQRNDHKPCSQQSQDPCTIQ